MVVLSRKARERRAKKKNAKKEERKYKAFIPLLKDIKGKRFTGSFTCACCRHQMTGGYVYTTDDNEYEICKYCNDMIFGLRPRPKVVFTPMGNKR